MEAVDNLADRKLQVAWVDFDPDHILEGLTGVARRRRIEDVVAKAEGPLPFKLLLQTRRLDGEALPRSGRVVVARHLQAEAIAR